MATRQQSSWALGIALVCAFPLWAASTSAPPLRVSAASASASQPSARQRLFAQLVSDRARAIDLAFGRSFPPGVTELRIVLLDAGKWADQQLPGSNAAYAPEQRTLYFARRLQFFTAPMYGTQQYWPWYEEPLRSTFPIVEIIDDALWTAVLKESARAHNLSWPHAQCGSIDIVERLPCEMLVQGVVAYTAQMKAPLFNENRMAEIWPENIAELRGRAWRSEDNSYQNVRKYGGYLLLRPLVREFGIARTLNYVAGTPFRIEHDNVRLSAERYQQQAQKALAW